MPYNFLMNIDEPLADPQSAPTPDPSEETEHLPWQDKKTPLQLRSAVEAQILASFGEIRTTGVENIYKIPPESKVIIASTHISDLDLPLVIRELGSHFDIAVTDQSTHHSLRQDSAAYMTNIVAGKGNFIPIDYRKDKEGKFPRFNPENFGPMQAALGKGKEILIAAHNPTFDGTLGSGAVGFVYLAQLSDAVILPVAVDIESKNPNEAPGIAGKTMGKMLYQRPRATVAVCEPIKLARIEGVEIIQRLMAKRANGEKTTPEERAEFSRVREALQAQADMVMGKLAEALPEQKRGEYGEPEAA